MLEEYLMSTSRLAALLAFLAIVSSVRAEEPAGELATKLAGVKFKQYAAAPGYSEGPTWWKGEPGRHEDHRRRPQETGCDVAEDVDRPVNEKRFASCDANLLILHSAEERT